MDRQISDAGVNPLEATFPAMCVAGMSAKGTDTLNGRIKAAKDRTNITGDLWCDVLTSGR